MDKDLALIVIRCIRLLMDEQGVSLESEHNYQLSINFRLDSDNGKITNLNLETPKICLLGKPKKEKK